MTTFKTFLVETYKNFTDREDKEKYVDEVMAILQSSYAAIGGVKTPSFKTREAAVNGEHLWKLTIRKGKVVVVNIYKDDGTGRKRILTGTDGTIEAKKELRDILKVEFERSYTEVSDAMEKFVFKYYKDLADEYKIPNTEALKILKPGEAKIPEDDDGYHYLRDIGGHWHMKIMVGTPGKRLTPKTKKKPS
jgi:hypothetical protein